MKNKYWLFGLGLLAVVVLAAGGWWVATQPYTFHGSLIEPAARAPDFALTRSDGKVFRLSDQRGKVNLLFFGYTSCPDVCPTTLSELKRVRARLAREADHVQFIFVTVDPERDTPERIHGYATAFDPTFIGLSGTMAELEPVWRAYGVYRQKVEGGTALGYTMDHSSRLYVIDVSGNLRLTYTFGENSDDIAQDINFLVGEPLVKN